MRKRIAIFGNSLFQDIKLKNNEYIIAQKKSMIGLSKFHDIDNYSMENLSILRAYELIRSIPLKAYYQDCVIALGEADLSHPELFKKTLFEMIEYLQSNNIRPLLVSLPEDILTLPAAQHIQDFIDEAACLYNVDYIYDGKTDKMVSYVVLDDSDMQKAIYELC